MRTDIPGTEPGPRTPAQASGAHADGCAQHLSPSGHVHLSTSWFFKLDRTQLRLWAAAVST